MTFLKMALQALAATVLLAVPAAMAEGLTDEQIEESRTYIINNATFVLFHESGHMLISELGLPVLGREEDAVDGLSSVMLLESEDEDLRAAMQDAADGWFLIDDFNGQAPEESDFQDTHGLDRQRAYSLVCMMAGADPEYFATFIESLDFPKERSEECAGEYAKTRDSWFGLLENYWDDNAQSNFVVTYEPAGEDLKYVEDILKEAEVLEAISATYGEGYKIPDGIKVTAKTCGTANAFWSPADREITFCYELAAQHAFLVVKYFEDNKKQ
jgi:hypothetical protein